LFLVFIGHPILEDEEKDKNKKISELDFLKAKYNTLLKLNNVKYPSNKQNYIYKDEYLSSFNNFTYLFFKKLNFSDFCPITLYNVLINVFMGISDEGLSKTLNNILGLNETERILFYSQIIQNNYFKDSDSEIKMSNGGFYNSDIVKENKSYVDKLTETYTECYKLSYKKDFNYILDWVDKSVNEKNFLKKDIFKDLGNTSLLLFSTLYYRQKWEHKFLDSKTYKGPFYINNEKSKEVMFLNHEYFVEYIYDYEDYYSFNDFYSN
jgi:serine protease inhibitor